MGCMANITAAKVSEWGLLLLRSLLGCTGGHRLPCRCLLVLRGGALRTWGVAALCKGVHEAGAGDISGQTSS